MTNRRTVFLAGAAALVLGGLPNLGLAQGTATPADALLQPAVDLLAAQETAVGELPGAHVLSVELDREQGALVYQVSLTSGDVDIDATTGSVLRVDLDD